MSLSGFQNIETELSDKLKPLVDVVAHGLRKYTIDSPVKIENRTALALEESFGR